MRYDDQTEMGGGHATFFTTQWSLIEAPSHDHDDEDRILIGSLVIDHPLSGWPEEAPNDDAHSGNCHLRDTDHPRRAALARP